MPPDSVEITSAERKTTKLWLYTAILVWGLSFILISVVGVYVIIRGQQVNAKLCEVTNDNRNILINILNTAKEQQLENASDIFERNVIRQRYNELRVLIPPLDCSLQGGPQELKP